ncbi:MAG: cell division protein FtsZ [Desulfovibrionaceae bacterium]|nr:cell division protein FtsZ [Desulfovibrionaceae bacterium]
MDDAEVLTNTDAESGLGARIKVIGVGGGGGNAVQHMIDSGLAGVEFVCANTDKQALNKSTAPYKIQLGEKQTKGRGAGASPKVGREAAMESINAIRDAIGDAEMLFVTAGMGGGTGTGGAPVVAQVAREMNVLTVGVVTKPFGFEGPRRRKSAEEGLLELKQYVDCLITIPNDRLIGLAPKKATFIDMLQRSNEVLYHAVKGISDVVNGLGEINLDFADVRTTMQQSGLALMGTGVGNGENRARDASQKAISSPLLEDVSLDSAKAILYNITGPSDMTIAEINEIGSMIREAAPEDCDIIFGVVFDDTIGDDLYVTLIATGIEAQEDIEDSIEVPHITQFQTKRGGEPTGGGTPKPVPPASKRRVGTPLEDYQAPVQTNVDEADGNDFRGSYTSRRSGSSRRMQHTPGKDMFTYDEDTHENYDAPSFIRRQAN